MVSRSGAQFSEPAGEQAFQRLSPTSHDPGYYERATIQRHPTPCGNKSEAKAYATRTSFSELGMDGRTDGWMRRGGGGSIRRACGHHSSSSSTGGSDCSKKLFYPSVSPTRTFSPLPPSYHRLMPTIHRHDVVFGSTLVSAQFPSAHIMLRTGYPAPRSCRARLRRESTVCPANAWNPSATGKAGTTAFPSGLWGV